MSSPSTVAASHPTSGNENTRLIDLEEGQLNGRTVKRCTEELRLKIYFGIAASIPLIGGGVLWLTGAHLENDGAENLGKVVVAMTSIIEGIFGAMYLSYLCINKMNAHRRLGCAI